MTDAPVELRSDTFTRPSEAMRRAMYEAEVGDEVWNEDPTVDRLEELTARLMGKEASIFLSSGTMGNLVGLLSHTRPGNEVILGDQSHIFMMEAAGTAVVGGLQLRTLPNRTDGRLRPDEVRAAIRDEDVHHPPTGAVALENTHGNQSGAVLRPEEMAGVAEVAHAAGVPVHLDGARVFNAAVALGIPVSELVASVDSVTFCLSKGLGAPVGGMLSGPAEFVQRARRWRKMLGGDMRQVGILAASGLYALENNVDRLAEDHQNARRLAEGLAEIPGVGIDPSAVETNIVFFDIDDTGLKPQVFLERLREEGVLLAGGPRYRAVTSYEVTRADIDRALLAVTRVLGPVPVHA